MAAISASVAHHVAAHGAVTDQEAGVHAQVPLQRTEILTEAGPAPRDPLLQRGEGHALHLGHHPPDVVGVLGLDRRQREAAVAADHGGHPMDVGRRSGRVPEELGVVVGVRIDDPGRDHETVGVEFGTARLLDFPDGGDAPALNADIGLAGRAPGAIDDRAGPDHIVEHETSDVVRKCSLGPPPRRRPRPL
jgi:hypothetical protein